MEGNFGILENKVLEAVGLIKELRADNKRLTGRCTELESQMAELREANSRMHQQLDQAREQARQVEDFEEKRKEIEDKVGGLLLKLESLG